MGQKERDFNFKIPAHPAYISTGKTGFQRELNIFFSIPSHGINDQTGIILLIPGFGGHALSNVYRKMRRVFADKFNLVTVQCDYLGSQFMQTPSPDQIRQFISNANTPSLAGKMAFSVNADLKETEDDYVDMGPIQAMDCLSAIFAVKEVIADNGYSLNWGRSIAYGHSHGAYLAHLCNLFAPGLFNLLIDNSAWLIPAYLHSSRIVTYAIGEQMIHLVFDYLVAKIGVDDENLYKLPHLYGKLDTDCLVIVYQGVTDNLVDHREKEAFAKDIKNCVFNIITENEVDGEIFGSTNHGLNSDHLKLFALAYESFGKNSLDRKEISLGVVEFETGLASYSINFTKGLPIFQRLQTLT